MGSQIPPPPRLDNTNNNLNPQLLIQIENPLRFDPNPDPRTRGFMDDKLLDPNHHHHHRYFSSPRADGSTSDERVGPIWVGRDPGSTPTTSNDEDEDEEEDDDDDNNNKVVKTSFGSVIKDGTLLQPCVDSSFRKMVTVVQPGDMGYSQLLLQGRVVSTQAHKDVGGDNGCGFSGRKESLGSCDHGDSLRAIFSDPITGALMDDAMILPCGHSFGRGGIQQVIKMKACYTCSNPVSEDSVAPNLSVQAAVQAFIREEEDMLMYRASKRRREKFEQEKGSFGDSSFSDTQRGRGVMFPFVVTDRVVIKGNKRTPERFVGREAIVTTQCLNGWYVVKTLDNAESVKLQYRSLEKVADNPSSKPMLSKMTLTPNWLHST